MDDDTIPVVSEYGTFYISKDRCERFVDGELVCYKEGEDCIIKKFDEYRLPYNTGCLWLYLTLKNKVIINNMLIDMEVVR